MYELCVKITQIVIFVEMLLLIKDMATISKNGLGATIESYQLI